MTEKATKTMDEIKKVFKEDEKKNDVYLSRNNTGGARHLKKQFTMKNTMVS